MAEATEQRDFFISFNGADLAYAEAIDAALKKAGFATYFHHVDLLPGGNIPKWMDDALMNSGQMLALYSPEYVADEAVYSESERYARFWQDSRGAKFKIIPIVLRDVKFTPLMGVYKRISARDMTPAQAALAVVFALKKPDEVQQREILHRVEPLPKIFNVLYRHNPNFTGRFDAMESLQKSLREGNAAITAVAGMGGVGKTTLAAEYCHRFGGRYGGVWWVRAEQESVMLADLVALGHRLSLTTSGNIEADARAALENIAARSEPWLMIYDNAPNADVVSKWLPVGAVRCLITSRFTGFDGIAAVARLGQWSDEVTADYLLVRTAREDKAGALRLAHFLGGLPLAAEQAAVFLKDRRGISFDEYAKEIARLIKEGKPTGAKGDYPDTVYAAFVKSLETLDEMKGGRTALALLSLCAFLSPDGVDIALLLTDKGGNFLPSNFALALTDKFARGDALAALASLSLLRQEGAPTGPTLIFHRLLLEVTRDWMGADARAEWGDAAVQIVDYIFPGSDHPATNTSVWTLCARLTPHVAALEANVPRTSVASKSLGRLLNQASIYLNARGDRVGSLAMGEMALTVVRQTEDEDPLNLAAGLSNLALRYINLDRLDDAEEKSREVLKIYEPLLAPDDPRLAVSLSNLAQLYRMREEFAKAEPLALRATKIMEHAYGRESGQYSTMLSNLALLYGVWAKKTGDETHRLQEEKYKAEELLICCAARGPRHPETAISHINLAIMKADREDWLRAITEAQRAVAIMLSLDLMRHPNTQLMSNGLVNAWRQNGEPDQATRLLRGDISALLPVIAQIEAEHLAWVAEDPKNRHFGPPSPFAKK